MKKFTLLLALFLCVITFSACANDAKNSAKANDGDDKQIETLKVQFVPSRDPQQIVTQTEPLAGILKDELAKHGFEVGKVDISVGTNYEATGEALSSGTVDVGFIPGGTYVLYSKDGADVLLTATRAGLSVEDESPKVWNENKPTNTDSNNQVTFYRSLVIAGPSAKGQELANKVNNGEALTWEDLNSAKWSVMNTSSSAGYIYPSLWLDKNFKKTITDLTNVVQADSYASSAARLASGQVDIIVGYADLRLDYADKWQQEFGREKSIWDETNVIGVGDKIYNDTISISKNSPIMTDELKEALAQSFIDIANTDEGKAIISIYNHEGYEKAEDKNYDSEREAQKLLRDVSK